ncbi:hypothetical protein MTP99_003687 [Tenebrio molitor]|uniref:protein takeout-like n=1 Tax=Tenebrio molitor TaxID=7067 RepID=UPI001C3B4A84|nr:hypothetical protein MTP99_003687 [Tenebrio molitor]CAH1379861.1 unnamed protein product [Tenebrio molitor]
MKTLLIFGVFALIKFCSSLSLPPSFKKCDKRKADFDECLSVAIQSAISQLDKPLEEYGLPSFEPFLIPNLPPKIGRKIDFYHRYKNFKIYGRTKIRKTRANMDFHDKTLTLEVLNPEVRYVFEYEAKGKMFLLPIDTSGAGSGTAYNVTYVYTFTFGEYTREDQRYFQVIDTHLVMQPQDMVFHFDNLLEDKELNDGFSRLLSKNWKIVFEEIIQLYVEIYGRMYSDVFNRFLRKVPVTEIFDGLSK